MISFMGRGGFVIGRGFLGEVSGTIHWGSIYVAL